MYFIGSADARCKSYKRIRVIYIAMCKHCSSENNFYFGQTTTQANIRMNGHRQKFNGNGVSFVGLKDSKSLHS